MRSTYWMESTSTETGERSLFYRVRLAATPEVAKCPGFNLFSTHQDFNSSSG
jgi:hypothetical protein